jgi:hypothetical protein
VREQIRRILDLVQKGRLSQEDAMPLLEALSPRLVMNDFEREFVFRMLAQDGASPENVAEHIALLKGLRFESPRAPMPPRPPAWTTGPGWQNQAQGGGWSWPGIEGIVDNISETVDRAIDTAFEGSRGGRRAARSGRTPTLLRVYVQDASGSETRANLPLSLAEHAPKLLPPKVLDALASQGMSAESLVLLLSSDPPLGELMSVEDHSGFELKLTIE